MFNKLIIIFIILGGGSLFGAGKSRVPYIGYLYPAGGKRGSDIQVIVGGMNLKNVKDVEISGGGIKIKSIKFVRPFNKLNNDLKRELKPILKAIDEGRDPIAEAKKSSENIIKRLKKQREREKKLALKDGKKEKSKPSASKPIKGTNNYDKMLAIVPGERLIYVDMTPKEVVKKIKALPKIEYECLLKDVFTRRNTLQTAPAIEQTAIINMKISMKADPGFRKLRVKGKQGLSNELLFSIDVLPESIAGVFTIDQKNTPLPLQIRSIVNGRIMPGEVDRYIFKAKAGEDYTFELLARALVPYLSDAVPGWFQAVISVHDSDGNILAYADDNRYKPDPVLLFKAPATGEYELRIRDSIYRGREDFIYRLKAVVGTPQKAKLKSLVLKNKIPKKIEREPNNSTKTPQLVTVPSLISGNISKPGDVDIYAFQGKKGSKVAVEVFGRRLDSSMDSLLTIIDDKGKILAWNDDYEWLNIGIKTHHSDSYILFELPSDGKYFIKVSETQAKGGENFDYQLRIDKPKPDFTVFMTPSALNGMSVASVPIRLEIFRKDGFKDAVDVVVKKGPRGLTLHGAHIPKGVNKIDITISAPRKVKPGLYDITLAAEAQINKKWIKNDVVPTDEIMQAFLYTHLVPTKQATFNIIRKGWLPVKPALPMKIALYPGGVHEFKLLDYQHKNRRKKIRECKELLFQLLSPPKGVTLVKTGYNNKHYLLYLKVAKNAKPWQGNLIIECIEKGIRKRKGQTDRPYTYSIGYLPAIPLKIMPLH